jgi:hypothetical protein
MKKLFNFVVIVLLSSFSAKSQWVHKPNDQMDSLNWNIIDMVRFNKTNDTTVIPVYPDDVARFEHRHFQLTGYMIPLKPGMKQSKFMISTLPINQCYFCGKNGNPIMVMVNSTSPVKFTFKTVTVDGILKLAKGNAYYMPPVSLDDAQLIE